MLGFAGVSDAQLLDFFVTQQDDAAFEALVKRHGAMVLSVCRRILKDPHDAQDAFQATFLVLVRKAATLAKRELVGNWLYGVAFRAALKMKQAKRTRHLKERQVEPMAPRDSFEFSDELLAGLDQEVNKLPEKYRAPLVFCDLEGMTRAQAASKLGWPIGTLNWRLARARSLVARGLEVFSTDAKGRLETIVQFGEHLRRKLPNLFLKAILAHQIQKGAANQAIAIQTSGFGFGRSGVNKQIGWIVFFVQVTSHLGHHCMAQALIVNVGLDYDDGTFFAPATSRMRKSGLQNIATLDVHESSGSSKPSPAKRSAVSAANRSISSVVIGLYSIFSPRSKTSWRTTIHSAPAIVTATACPF